MAKADFSEMTVEVPGFTNTKQWRLPSTETLIRLWGYKVTSILTDFSNMGVKLVTGRGYLNETREGIDYNREYNNPYSFLARAVATAVDQITTEMSNRHGNETLSIQMNVEEEALNAVEVLWKGLENILTQVSDKILQVF